MHTKEHIAEVVRKHVIEVLSEVIEFDDSDFDVHKTMEDLGADSLDVVEITSRTIRELKIKVSPTQLEGISSAQELVELLAGVSDGSISKELS